MTTAELRDAAHRCFLRLAPAVLACEGDAGLERALLGDPSLGITGAPWAMATKADLDYFHREIAQREAITRVGALQTVLHSSACIAVALHVGD